MCAAQNPITPDFDLGFEMGDFWRWAGKADTERAAPALFVHF